MDRQAHFAQLLARARERPNMAVHDSAAPLDSNGQIVRAQYVVLHDVGPDAVHLRFTERRSVSAAATMRAVGRCVGVDPDAARRMAGAFKTQMDGFVIVTPGRKCWPVEVEEAEVEKDDKVSPPLWFVDVDLTYRTEPAG